MSKKLAGTLFVYNGNKFDYSYKEAIQCLLEFCEIVIVAAGGNDNTYEDVLGIAENYQERVIVKEITNEEWAAQQGKEKLNYFTNITIEIAEKLGYEYQFNLQSDECVHEKSYDAIRMAVESGGEGFMCKRINLWSSPYLQLNVSADRLPCSTNIVRLAKTNYRSYGDAESLAVDNINMGYLEQIRIYHMGFVRKREVMKAKIINMQQGVFAMEHYDPKLDQSEVFNPDLWFNPKTDLKPIDEPLPKLIQQWARERYEGNKIII